MMIHKIENKFSVTVLMIKNFSHTRQTTRFLRHFWGSEKGTKKGSFFDVVKNTCNDVLREKNLLCMNKIFYANTSRVINSIEKEGFEKRPKKGRF
jgi:hypothetical protein